MSVGTPIVAICSLTFAFSLGFEFLRTKSKKSRRTSCAIRMLLLLIPNRLQDLKYESLSPIGSLVHSHGVLRLQQPVLRLQPPWRLVLLEQGCERSELPCPGFGGGELGRRPWSFYI